MEPPWNAAAMDINVLWLAWHGALAVRKQVQRFGELAWCQNSLGEPQWVLRVHVEFPNSSQFMSVLKKTFPGVYSLANSSRLGSCDRVSLAC